MTAGGDRSETTIFDCGGVTVRPRERLIEKGNASIAVEPLVMQLLVTLAARPDQLVTRREIFESCWGRAPVGDDSLNRIVAALRKALRDVAGDSLRIETIPSAGYVLRLLAKLGQRQFDDIAGEQQEAVAAAFDSWRLGLPTPDFLNIERLRRVCDDELASARAWGLLALLYRHAAEYAGSDLVSGFVADCERAARRALRLDPHQSEARVALLSVIPLLGRWSEARGELLAVLERDPESMVANQDLATLEMATGRVVRSMELRDRLVARDPLGACFCYKAVYQHWSTGDIAGMDMLADRALSLWPTHPAVWNVRLWTFAYTGREAAAAAMLDSGAAKPAIPRPTLNFLRTVLQAVERGDRQSKDRAIAASLEIARSGPANAIASLFSLGLLGDTAGVFDVIDAYYVRDGSGPVPHQHTSAEMSLNEHHRRFTQILFTPVFSGLRSDSRFSSICKRLGLTRYWEENQLTPDFLT